MSRLTRVSFGVADLISAALLALGVFAGLPDRWLPVDTVAVLLIGLDVVAGSALLANARWANKVALVSSALSLAVGLALVTALALSASYLSGIYGPIGRGGAVILALVAALALPYLVLLPSVQLVWLRPSATKPDHGTPLP
jgi:hypothetical protein